MIAKVTRYVEYRCKKCGHGKLTPVLVDGHTNELLEAKCAKCKHVGEPDATTLMTGPDGKPLL